MQFRTRRATIRVDVPHLIVVTAIVGFCIWYFFDARNASNTLENMLLIEPAAICAFILYVIIMRQVVTVVRDPAEAAPPRPPLSPIVRTRIFGCMLLLAAYVGLMNIIGFDVATVIYVAATLALLGERRKTMLIILPVVFAAIVVYAFRQLVTVPVPTLFDLLS